MTILEDLAAKSQLHWSDYIVLIAYFVIVIGVGIWVSEDCSMSLYKMLKQNHTH